MAETVPTTVAPAGLRRFASLTLASWFGVGFIPLAPGTWGTAAAMPLAWLVSGFSLPCQLLTAAVVIGVGVAAAAEAGRILRVIDASQIVVDEVAGLLVTLIGIRFTLPTALAAFVLFRLFDILKPWPASYFDRKVKNGAGVVLDDVMAGLYSRLCMWLLALAWPHLFSP